MSDSEKLHSEQKLADVNVYNNDAESFEARGPGKLQRQLKTRHIAMIRSVHFFFFCAFDWPAHASAVLAVSSVPVSSWVQRVRCITVAPSGSCWATPSSAQSPTVL